MHALERCSGWIQRVSLLFFFLVHGDCLQLQVGQLFRGGVYRCQTWHCRWVYCAVCTYLEQHRGTHIFFLIQSSSWLPPVLFTAAATAKGSCNMGLKRLLLSCHAHIFTKMLPLPRIAISSHMFSLLFFFLTPSPCELIECNHSRRKGEGGMRCCDLQTSSSYF